MIKRFLQTDMVGPKTHAKVVGCLSELHEYIAGFPSVLKLSVILIGSYSSGLAFRSGSMVDLIVRMDGGALTASLDGDQLALALSAGLKDWPYLKNLTPLGNNSGTLICETRDPCIILRIRACNTERFPVSNFFHSKLFSSYSNIDPKIVVFISGLKHWARTCGFSSPVPFSNCPFSGFHWTILAIFFLTQTNLVPNLHATSGAPRVQYGPGRLDFWLVSDRVEGYSIGKYNIKEVFEFFFQWLGKTDLLATSVSLQPNEFFKRGWLNIFDPCAATIVNTVDANNQKDQVVFAMKLQREALLMTTLVKNATDISDLIYTKTISMLSNGDGPVHKIDVATN